MNINQPMGLLYGTLPQEVFPEMNLRFFTRETILSTFVKLDVDTVTDTDNILMSF